MVASILFCLLSTSTALGVTKKILCTAGKWVAKKPKPFAPKKHSEGKKNNPKIIKTFGLKILGLSID
jgi:hypothetical protein